MLQIQQGDFDTLDPSSPLYIYIFFFSRAFSEHTNLIEILNKHPLNIQEGCKSWYISGIGRYLLKWTLPRNDNLIRIFSIECNEL